MDPISLTIFASRMSAVCAEMGAVLRRAALSPNIKDRLDFSCAVFDADGLLCAQAAHIPVHLGSMAYAMSGIVRQIQWQPGDMVVLNDPFLGGTHLPDITVIAPVFRGERCVAFVANRAHHADIGAHTPGSMPLSRSLDEEGLLIAPQHLVRQGAVNEALLTAISDATGVPAFTRGDFAAQLSANRTGVARIGALIDEHGVDGFCAGLQALNDYGERLARAALARIAPGRYAFTDYMDDDGVGGIDLPIAVTLDVSAGAIAVDFAGTAPQAAGNINCPLSVAAAAVYYVFRCLMPDHTPACAGSFRPISITAPRGCLVNAQRPAAVAAGNVETSTRIVDAVLGALARAIPDDMPAASHGGMNNLAMGARSGGRSWDYYETIGGGMGAGPRGGGVSGVQTHMTNTLNTPIESLETHFPLRVVRYQLRRGSGGAGRRRGGEGLIRSFEFLAPTTVTVLSERRRRGAWGLAGGASGAPGENWLDARRLPGKTSFIAQPGQQLTIMTPGGGGWGDDQLSATADSALHCAQP